MKCELCNNNDAEENQWIVYKGNKRAPCAVCKSIYWQGIDVGRAEMSEKLKSTMKELIEQKRESK
jgi:hypothetical protein